MSYRPDFSAHRPSASLAQYQDRVGRLYRDEREVGCVLVLVEASSQVVGGRLWWRRWAPPEDALNLWTVIDGQFGDHWVPEDAIAAELADYDAGRFAFYGEPLQVVWTDADESVRLRKHHFDAQAPLANDADAPATAARRGAPGAAR